jgi:5-methylcytosine-specific restriction endonuclease McrA
MQKHTANYFKYFSIGMEDTIFCEVCGMGGRVDRGGFDLHHIVPRSQGGGDEVENIILLCRKCHNAAHGLEKTYLHKDVLKAIHNEKLNL